MTGPADATETIACGGVTWEVAVAARAELGERPVWDPITSSLIWVDIKAGRLHRHHPGERNDLVIDLGDGKRPIPIGAAAHRSDGGYVIAAADGFRLASPSGRFDGDPVRPEGMGEDMRFNDAACDPQGRFWAGTVANDRRSGAGALYRLDPDGWVDKMLDGITESNGLGWSPDGATMYYIDSGEPEPRIRAFPFDADTGSLGASRDLVRFPFDGAVPDGLVVDSDGGLWVALYNGGAVRHYSPAGELLATLPVPVSCPTCPGFGGPDLAHLYLTTAWQTLTADQRAAEPLAGHVLRAMPGARGLPAYTFPA